MISRRATLELDVDCSEVHAGDALTGFVRLRNPSSRAKTYRDVELRLENGRYKRADYKPRTVWLLREELSVPAAGEGKVPFEVRVPGHLNSGMAELSVICEPLRLSLMGPPVALLHILPHREYVAMAHALEAVGNAQLPKWCPEPRNSSGTDFIPVTKAPGIPFVSRFHVSAAEYGKVASGQITVSRMDADKDGAAFESGVAQVPFRVSLENLNSLEDQFSEALAPLWNGSDELPVPASPRSHEEGLPLPYSPTPKEG